MAKKQPKIDITEVHTVARLLSRDTRRRLGLTVPARIYVQDPLVAARNPKLGLEEIELDWEPGMADGPTSARVVVVDVDEESGQRTEPARWEPQKRRFVGADDPHSWQFHQVNAWAIVQNTLAFFEDAHILGRPIPWGFDGNRITVVPHAGRRQHACYDRNLRSLRFYYCGDADNPVYTCLSHDIVAHETGHAILDGIRPLYAEISSPQTMAMHEFVADITAILSALRNNTVRNVIAEVSGGDLTHENTVADLAEEFGHSVVRQAHGEANRFYLRTANNPLTMVDIEGKWESHYCSQVLTGAMFEVLARMTQLHLGQGESASEALWHATDRITRIALRPLDYCPPADVQFIDYARAVLRADALAYPDDNFGYREIIRDVFRQRGFGDVRAENAPYVAQFQRYDVDDLSRSRTTAYHFLHENRQVLGIPLEQDVVVVDLYETDKKALAERRLPREIVLLYLWREEIPLQEARFKHLRGEKAMLLCGGTLVFDGRGNVLSLMRKPGLAYQPDREEGERRREMLLDTIATLAQAGWVSLAGEKEIAGAPVIGWRTREGLRLEASPSALHRERR